MVLKINSDTVNFRAVRLTGRGLALCHFMFRDGPALGLAEQECYRIGKELIAEWDGSKTLLEIYQQKQRGK